jgi:hypothetical protein
MSQAKWLIEENVFGDRGEALIAEVKRQGLECKTITHLPFLDEGPQLFDNDDCVIFYGSINLAKELKRTKPWIPGMYATFPNFKCSEYYNYFDLLLNDHCIFMPMLHAIKRKDWIFETFAKDGKVFVRPDSGEKHFTGKLLSYDEFNEKGFEYKFYYDTPILLLIASPKPIKKEYRCVVADKKCIAIGSYDATLGRENVDIPISPDEHVAITAYVDLLCDQKWQPDRVFTLDLVESEEELQVVEINSFSCAGLYNCDPEPIVRVVSRIAVDEWREYQS